MFASIHLLIMVTWDVIYFRCFFFFGFVLVLIVVPLLKYLTRVLFRYCEVLDKMFSLGIANVLQNS